ncbi:MAG: 50S ribosomal protein L32 [Kiritimatiellae bacterium]|nr:50S ribosomal protein L32 [Verrucomicrobiota bacterium]MCG2658839.1 50S ribosomal protein L32 [Kiritimatiellia bacterium]
MAVPKRKTSKSRIRIRKRSHKETLTATQACANCGEPHQPHRVCPLCGYYKGRQVLTIITK